MLRTYSDVQTPYDYTDIFKAVELTEREVAKAFETINGYVNMLAEEDARKLENEIGELQETIGHAKYIIMQKLQDIFIKIARESCE